MEVNTIIQGDVLEVARTLPNNSVNCIVTSPPYYGLRDYGTAKWVGGVEGCNHKPKSGLPRSERPGGKPKGQRTRNDFGSPTHDAQEDLQYAYTCKKCGAIRKDNQIGIEDTPEEYVTKMVEIFRELRRVLRDDGTCWLNLGDSYAANRGYQVTDNKHCNVGNNHGSSVPVGLKPKDLMGIPWRVAFDLQADGWWLRSDIIWDKKNPMPESVTDRPTKSHEYVFLLSKSARYWYDQEAIREPIKESSKQRISQPNFDNQKGGPKDYRNGINSNRSARNTLENFKKSSNQGRNKRSVWSIATSPYKEAHFAAMPPKLAETCILAGCPSRVCSECGEPWVRMIEREAGGKEGWGVARKDHHINSQSTIRDGNGRCGYVKTKTTGFTPTCTCDAPHQPGLVLDPFFGSGTTGAVAKQLKRNWAGIELSPEYIKLAQKRLDQTQPALFAR